MKHITICPVCHSSSFEPLLSTRDFFLTHESFSIIRCSECGCGLTSPRPDKDELPAYYHSASYISHSSSGKGLLSKLYVMARSFTLKKKYRLVTAVSKVKSGAILDIGCGSGELLHVFKRNNWLAVGVEPARIPRDHAIERYGLDVIEGAFLKDLPPGKFDVITLWHSLEHIENIDETMQQVKRLLAPGGTLFVALPNHLAWEAAHFGEFWAGWDVPRHLYHFSTGSMHQLMANYRLTISLTVPLKLDAYYISLLSHNYKYGKMDYPAAFFKGRKSNRYARNHNKQYSSLIYVINHEIM